MLLKRLYDPATLGVAGRTPACIGVRVKHTGSAPAQNFSSRLVAQAMAEGWMSINGSTLTVSAEPEDLKYSIKRAPGYYCLHSGQPIPISAPAWIELASTGVGRLAAAEALAWRTTRGVLSKTSPDPRWPHGYAVLMHYECELDPAQHKKFRAGV
jgi:hypothetical protein